MPSLLSHLGLGIVIAELFLRYKVKRENYVSKRPYYWLIGILGGIFPDLDFIFDIIKGTPFLTYHHALTHTFLFLAIVFLFLVISRWNMYMIVFSCSYAFHIFIDFVDNSIPPFSPLNSTPYGINVIKIFEKNEWGWYLGDYFLTYYDLSIILFSIFLFIWLFYLEKEEWAKFYKVKK